MHKAKKCSECGELSYMSDDKCSICGAKLEEVDRLCPKCGQYNYLNTDYCCYCNAKLRPDEKTEEGTSAEPDNDEKDNKNDPMPEDDLEDDDGMRQYKCPSCGSPLRFSITTGKLTCESCDNEYDIGSINGNIGINTEALRWKEKFRKIHKETLPEMTVYTCESCGAEIITDGTTAATHCPCCDNEVIITDKLNGILKPDGIIPFKIYGDGLKGKIKKYCKRKHLLPKNFIDDYKIDAVQGIYVPVWLFGGSLIGTVSFKGTLKYKEVIDDQTVEVCEHYHMKYDGGLSFSNVPVDGSIKIPDDLMNSIEPFDYSQIVSFDCRYLSGFLAERFDQDPDLSLPIALKRMTNTAVDRFKDEASKRYSPVYWKNDLKLNHSSMKYVLLPVYMFNVVYSGKTYRFAMNGQTGKLVGELPICKIKKRLSFWIPFLASFALTVLFMIFR